MCRFHGENLNLCLIHVHKWKLKRISGPEGGPWLPSAFKLLFAVVGDVHSLPASRGHPTGGNSWTCVVANTQAPGATVFGSGSRFVALWKCLAAVPRVTQGKAKLHVPQIHLKNQSDTNNIIWAPSSTYLTEMCCSPCQTWQKGRRVSLPHLPPKKSLQGSADTWF